MTIFNETNVLQLKKQLKWKKVAWTNGCFDIIHPWHIKLLQTAKSLSDVLVVWINSDKSAYWQLVKKRKPYITETDRAYILNSIKYVDFVIIFQQSTPINIIKQIKPKVIVKWSDYGPYKSVNKLTDITKEMKQLIKEWKDKISVSKNYILGSKEVIENWWKIYILPLYKNYSTTKLKNG